jgi:hypothetical protein
MLISVLGFGSIWMRRRARERDNQDRHDRRSVAYYNTTGVLIGDRIRNRPRAYGVDLLYFTDLEGNRVGVRRS